MEKKYKIKYEKAEDTERWYYMAYEYSWFWGWQFICLASNLDECVEKLRKFTLSYSVEISDPNVSYDVKIVK